VAKKPAPRIMTTEDAGEILAPVGMPAPRLTPLRDPAKLLAREEFAAEIRRAWLESQESFLLIGRYLLTAKERLQHGEFMAMVASDLPFSHQTANKLMSVARFIESGDVPPDALPPASETCYQITTLTSEERAQALAEGVIRPQMQREDILKFKRRARMSVHDAETERHCLEAERAKLVRRLEEIDQALAALNERGEETLADGNVTETD
jgi:hypothetical protein